MSSSENYIQDIAKINTEFGASFGRSDAKTLADIYSKEGMLLPPNHQTVSGYDNILAFWQDVLEAGITDAKLETVELDKSGETVVEVGRFTMKAGDQIADVGKYIVIWKQEDGVWKYHRDIWSSDNSA